jgi:hypothetical protein
MSDLKKVGTNEEIHGYDALDRLESDWFDRTPGGSASGESAYDQLWLGDDVGPLSD